MTANYFLIQTSKPVIFDEWKSKIAGWNEDSSSVTSREIFSQTSWLFEVIKKIISSVEIIAIEVIAGFSVVAHSTVYYSCFINLKGASISSYLSNMTISPCFPPRTNPLDQGVIDTIWTFSPLFGESGKTDLNSPES